MIAERRSPPEQAPARRYNLYRSLQCPALILTFVGNGKVVSTRGAGILTNSSVAEQPAVTNPVAIKLAQAHQPDIIAALSLNCVVLELVCMEATSSNNVRRRGEPWALGSVVGYAAANIFDRVAVVQADPLIGPVLRGLPSLALGILLMWKHRTLNQLRPVRRNTSACARFLLSWRRASSLPLGFSCTTWP